MPLAEIPAGYRGFRLLRLKHPEYDAQIHYLVSPLQAKMNRDNGHALTMVSRLLPGANQRLLQPSPSTLIFNMAAFRRLSRHEVAAIVRDTFAQATCIANEAGRTLAPSLDFRAFTIDALGLLADTTFGDAEISALLAPIAEYQSQCGSPRSKHVWSESPVFPDYKIAPNLAAVRYGNVELRVIENYLFDPEQLRATLETVMRKSQNESQMYERIKWSDKLLNNNFDFNLRRLITNAGFYVEDEPESAWSTFEEWANRYIGALRNSHLFWHNPHAVYYLRIQHKLFEQYGYVPRYVQMPNRFQIYDNIGGKDVLFVSPLAHIVNEQVLAGRIKKLYKNYEVPDFTLRAVPAWVSTWPNRPHGDWFETFRRMCESVEAAYREKPFEVFIAACGCYGLPICDFARSQFGCSTLYIGHAAHGLFGLFPVAANQKINPEMWAEGDLGRHANVDKIDGGRYI
jgi:hypothetical protein